MSTTTQPLTPAQLHELVSGPYTMPDGTKRRGIWERVPSARVENLRFAVGVSSPYWKVLSEPPGALTFAGHWAAISVPHAQSLIRVAVEDWLMSIMGGLAMGRALDYSDDGTTILHVLVAIAHAVADEQGVPH